MFAETQHRDSTEETEARGRSSWEKGLCGGIITFLSEGTNPVHESPTYFSKPTFPNALILEHRLSLCVFYRDTNIQSTKATLSLKVDYGLVILPLWQQIFFVDSFLSKQLLATHAHCASTKAKPSQSVNIPTYRYQVYQEIDILPHSTQSGEIAVKHRGSLHHCLQKFLSSWPSHIT